MYESLKNQVINAVEDTYFRVSKNKYTGFLRVTFRDLLKHMINWYGKIMTTDLKYNNQRMNEPIDSSLPIDKYFNQIDDCIQFDGDDNIPYIASKVVQNYHHVLLASVVYVDACK